MTYFAMTGNSIYFDKELKLDELSLEDIDDIITGCTMNTLFAINAYKVFHNINYDICRAANTRFLMCGYINDYLIKKYHFNELIYPLMATPDVCRYILENYPDFSNIALKPLIASFRNDILLDYDSFIPSEKCIRLAAYYCNTDALRHLNEIIEEEQKYSDFSDKIVDFDSSHPLIYNIAEISTYNQVAMVPELTFEINYRELEFIKDFKLDELVLSEQFESSMFV